MNIEYIENSDLLNDAKKVPWKNAFLCRIVNDNFVRREKTSSNDCLKFAQTSEMVLTINQLKEEEQNLASGIVVMRLIF